ncbi:MAG: toxin-antitoxin system YwqK family antitoxin [Flavobacteriales bacterium]
MLHKTLIFATLLLTGSLCAQPDSLYITTNDTSVAYAVRYGPMQTVERFRLVGKYAFDTTRTAVQIDYKRGKPSGIYRAYYPDGKPLIFAVYGWGSLHGDWTEYDPLGRITVKGQYRMGKRDGTWAFREQGIVGHYKDGQKQGSWKYYENGKLVRKEKWRKGQIKQGGTFLFR